MKSKLQVSRFLALHVHVPILEILEHLCFHVDGSDVFAGQFSSWTLTNTCVFVHLCLFQLWLKASWLAPPATSPHNCAVSALLKSLTNHQHLWLCNGTKMWILSCNNNVYDVLTWRPGYNYCLNSIFNRLRGLFLVLSWITASVRTHALQYSLLINPMPHYG